MTVRELTFEELMLVAGGNEGNGGDQAGTGSMGGGDGQGNGASGSADGGYGFSFDAGVSLSVVADARSHFIGGVVGWGVGKLMDAAVDVVNGQINPGKSTGLPPDYSGYNVMGDYGGPGIHGGAQSNPSNNNGN